MTSAGTGAGSLRRLSFPTESPPIRLVCFPYAGAGAFVFRSWAAELPENVELLGVQLPGREDRIQETPRQDIASLADDLAIELSALLDRPLAIFGHSLGAIVGAEVARRLDETFGCAPSLLIVSGCQALPQIAEGRIPLHTLDDDELLVHVRRLNGTPEEILQDPQMRAFVLRLVRADYALFASYEYRDGPPLACRLVVLGGDVDEATTSEGLDAWAVLSSASTEVHLLPGSHFFLHSARDQFLALLANELSSVTT